MTQALKPRDDELAYFSRRFRVSPVDIKEFVNYYNSDFSAYDNHVYKRVESRIAHWWNYSQHNWFGRRIKLALAYLADSIFRERKKVLLIDVGFSVPYAYTRADLSRSDRLVQLLVDKEESAKRFFKAIVDLYEIHRPLRDGVLAADIEHPADRERVAEKARYLSDVNRPDEVLLVASEVIEHLDEPECFWQFVETLEHRLDKPVIVYATLPVGQKIPSHTLEFITAEEALAYFREHMNIAWQRVLKPVAGTPISPYLTECVCVRGVLLRKTSKDTSDARLKCNSSVPSVENRNSSRVVS